MADKEYIEREALMEQVKAIHRAVNTADRNISYDTGFHSATSQIQGLIAWMPAADVVEVVRCKDCKHCEIVNSNECYAKCHKLELSFEPFGKVDTRTHFCGYGERKG